MEWFCQNLGDRFPHTNPSCFADSTGPYIVSRLCALVLAAASVASLSCLVSNFSKFLLMPCKNQTYFLFRRHCIRTSSFFVLACQLQVWKLMIFWKFLFSQYDRLKKKSADFMTRILLEILVKLLLVTKWTSNLKYKQFFHSFFPHKICWLQLKDHRVMDIHMQFNLCEARNRNLKTGV